jgi:hypothetical protein
MHRVLRRGGRAVISDLRRDASSEDIDLAVGQMGLGRVNSAMTRWIFKHSLLRRAYRPEDFRLMAARTSFGACEVRTAGIGMDVTFRK